MVKRILTFIIAAAFFSGFFVPRVFGYGVETHAFLTDEIIKFYNERSTKNKIGEDLKSYVIDGARLEDNFPRYFNHFYDPVNNRGLADGIYRGMASKSWSQDEKSQTALLYKVFPQTEASLLTAVQIAKIQPIFSKTNFTWQKAVNLYARGEIEQALFALGHILHLIEDASVPDHTRNDAHPPFDDGGSPYENWTGKFDLKNPDTDLVSRLKNKKPIGLDNLDTYFDAMANYSNNNFYSKDSIKKYDLPKPDTEKEVGDSLYLLKKDSEFGDYYLASKNKPDVLTGKDNPVLTDDNILQSYWSRLSTKSVQYGAGIIDLFFKEAEAARQKYLTEKAQRPYLATFIDGFKNIFGNGEVRDIADTVNEFRLVGEVPIAKEATSNKKQKTSNQQEKPQSLPLRVVPTDETKPEIETEIVALQLQSVEPVKIEAPTLCSFSTLQSPSRQGVILNEVAWMGSANSPNDEWIELKNISGGEIDLDGWQVVDLGEQIKIQLSGELPAGGFYLLERTDDNSVPGIVADQLYTGALANVGEGLHLFGKNCNLVDEVMAAPDWPAGNNDYKKTMERASDFSWRNYSGGGQNGIYGTPKAENSIGSAPVNYSSGGLQNSGAQNNQAAQEVASSPAKILITEVQITGGAGKSDNDFIEIYNPNDSAVNLKGYRLVKRTKNGVADTGIKSWTEDAIIQPKSFYLWANSNYTDIFASPDVTTSATIASDNGVAIRFGGADQGAIIDSIGFGEAQNGFIEGQVFPTNPPANQSIQRKILNNDFLDTNNNATDFEVQNCPSPKTRQRTCPTGQSNQAPGAFFDYAPKDQKVGDLITFDATSSTDSDGSIAFYQWDFGDGATTTVAQPAVTHIYSAANNYLVQLTVLDNQSASSTMASTTVSVSPATVLSTNVNHIVISEVQIAGIDAGDEFIELYNPTESEVDLSGRSIQYLSGATSSLDSILKKNFDAGNKIAAKGFFLIARNKNNSGTDGYSGNKTPDLGHRTFSMSGASTGAKIFLVNGQENLSGFDDPKIVDKLDYSFSVPPAGQSLERKAFQNNSCVSAQNAGEYFGNGCDTDNDQDNFESRAAPNPQNTQSLPEPRSAPAAVQNFNAIYSPGNLELTFNWATSTGFGSSTITYRLSDINSVNSTIVAETASTTASQKIKEIGRDYKFEIVAIDNEGLASEIVQSTINVSSFINSLSFYRDPRPTAPSDYVLEFDWQDYPFVPVKFKHLSSGQEIPNGWHIVIFYYNQEPQITDDIFWIDLTEKAAYKSWGLIAPGGLKVKYPNCLGSNYQTGGAALILPDGPYQCSAIAGNHTSYGLNLNQLEDNHLLLEVANDNFINAPPIVDQDYVTLAFYAYQPGYEPNNYGIKLAAIDKTKYYFHDDGPDHQPPTPVSNVNFDFNATASLLKITWDQSTDADTLDSLISYFVDFVGNSISAATQFIEIPVEPAAAYDFELSAKDDFGNLSDLTAANYIVPDVPLPYELTDVSWGRLDNPDSVSLNLEFNEYPFMDVGAPSAMIFFLNQTPPANYSFLDDDYRNGAGMGGSNNSLKLSYFPCDFNGAWTDKRTVGGAIFNNADCPTNGSSAISGLLLAKLASGDTQFTAEAINDQEFSESDYITIGFYQLGPRDQSGTAYFTNVANYNKKIYFQP